MKLLVLIRGLPGSGKSTLANKLVLAKNHLEADTFHLKDGKYDFKYENLSNAHDWCRLETERRMRKGFDPIVVSNTFTTNEEMKKYIELADKYEYVYQIIAIENVPFENKHAVPEEIIEKMGKRWEQFREIEK